jgi:hypothetical protein
MPANVTRDQPAPQIVATARAKSDQQRYGLAGERLGRRLRACRPGAKRGQQSQTRNDKRFQPTDHPAFSLEPEECRIGLLVYFIEAKPSPKARLLPETIL